LKAAAALEIEIPIVIRSPVFARVALSMTSRWSWVGPPLWFAFACLAVLGAPPAAAVECHGPVGKNETLWPIALRLRPDPSISPQRMMLALLKANPDAFSRHNVNTLESGATLCFGPEDTIGLDDEAAIAEVRRQNQEWKSGRTRSGAGLDDPVYTPPASGGGEEAAALRPAGILAGIEARLARIEGLIGELQPRPDPEGVVRALASLDMRVARIEDRLGVLAAQVETMIRSGEHEAMEPMPTPAPASHEAMEPMPTPAPASHEAMEPMPTPAPASHEAMEPMPTPAPASHEAMEPMPTPAPASHEAMEPMPTPAPASHEAMEPMPTPAPASHEALTTESVSARIATWRERVRELREQ